MMTTSQFEKTVYCVLAGCILTIIVAYAAFDFVEVDTAIGWTMEYFAIPILCVASILSCAYLPKFMREHDVNRPKTRWMRGAKTVAGVFSMSFGSTFIFCGTIFSCILLSNAYSGDSRTIVLNATIVDYQSTRGKWRTTHSIKIYDPQLERVVNLTVGGVYEVGAPFKKQMKIGRWGLLYSEA